MKHAAENHDASAFQAQQLHWQRRRLWVTSPVSPLAGRATSSKGDMVTVTCNLRAVHHKYLWEHQARFERFISVSS